MEPSCTTRTSAATQAARALTIPPASSANTQQGGHTVRNSIVTSLAAALALLVVAHVDDHAQRGQGVPEPLISQGVLKMPNPPGPAPKRDLSGTWVGPRAGAPEDNAAKAEIGRAHV